ncbi:MAG: ABC transporter ATP-binding protein [Alphaproteobacteria bacterium]
MLELRQVAKVVEGETHIAPTSLTLASGSLNVLLGPSLSGKTSLLRLMAGLDRPTSGTVWVDGRDVTGLDVRKRNVAMVYQQFVNYPALTVFENIASPLRLANTPAAEIDAKVRAAAELMRLTSYLDRTPLTLSGGQQQRTALARALVKGAGLVLLDEPLANLDYKLREELREELPRIFAKSGSILVYATTEPSEALLLGGNTATLHEGRITQLGPTIEVFRSPADLITAQAFSDPPLNTVSARKAGASFVLDGGLSLGAPKGLADGAYVLGVRPHHLALAAQGKASAGLGATVSVTEITGSESFVHFPFGGSDWVMLTPGVHEFQPGEAIMVFLDPSRMMVFSADGQALVN